MLKIWRACLMGNYYEIKVNDIDVNKNYRNPL